MDFFDKLIKSEGGYIFLSHSHADIKIIRKIRNCLEENDFEPLCFFLKCLEDSNEIADLIKREIDAREWFIFANSKNSRKSKWVTLEREYIKETGNKKIITIDIDDPAAIDAALNHILHNLRIFISHMYEDEPLAQRIQSALEQKDYLVYSSHEHWNGLAPSYADHFENVHKAIDLASRDGCVIALIRPNSANPEHSRMYFEVQQALHTGGNVFPVIVGDIHIDDSWMFETLSHQGYHLSNDPTDAEIRKLVDQIGRSIVEKAKAL